MPDFAPGLPDRNIFTPITSRPGQSRLVIQRHKATHDHYDMRLQDGDKAHSWVIRKLPTESDKILAIRQPTHTSEYMSFEGDIKSGYGKGSVRKAYDNPVDVLHADESRVKMVLPEGEFTMVHLKDKNWLMVKNKNTIPNPVTTKPDYKDASNKELDFNDPDKVLQPKIDGGHTVFRLHSDGPNRIYSYRTSKKDNRPIEHTHQSPNLRDAVVPKELNGVEVRGEIYAKDKSGKALPAEEVGGILNSGIENSRKAQAEKGSLLPYMFKVVKWKGGKNVENSTYREQIDMMKEISSKVPEFRMPEIAATPDQKRELFNQIKSKMHPDTTEGVIQWSLGAAGGDPKKVKLRDTHEVVIRSIFPAESKRKMAGGFEYSWEPEGKIVGRVGTGFTQKMREEMLADPKKYLGRVARIKAQQIFESGAARAPSFYQMHVEKNLVKAAKLNYFNGMDKTAFKIDKKMLITAGVLSPVTGYVIYNKDKYFPKKTFRGEFARNITTDAIADLAFTGTGALIGRKFGRPDLGAAAGFALSYVLPTALNTKRMLDMHKTSALKDFAKRYIDAVTGEKVKVMESFIKNHPEKVFAKKHFTENILKAKKERNIARVATGAAVAVPVGVALTKEANTNDIGHYTSHATPYNMGMYAKKQGLSRSKEAIPQGVEKSLVHGAIVGAVGGAALGGPISTRIFTAKGREKAVDEALVDYEKLKSGVNRTKVEGGSFSSLLKSEGARKLNRKEIQEILVRRTKAGARGAAIVGVGMAGLRLATNALQYGAGKASADKAIAKQANLDVPPKALVKIEDLVRKLIKKPAPKMAGVSKTGPNDYKINWK